MHPSIADLVELDGHAGNVKRGEDETQVLKKSYTPGTTNIAGWKWTQIESMHFLLNMGIFQPAMLVCQRVSCKAVVEKISF